MAVLKKHDGHDHGGKNNPDHQGSDQLNGLPAALPPWQAGKHRFA